jgi:hypothetical protein
MIWKWRSCVHSGFPTTWLSNRSRPRLTAASSCLHLMTPIQRNFLLLWWLVMSLGSAMPYLRRNNSPRNGDIMTVLLQKRSNQHWHVETSWKPVGIGLLGHTRNPAHWLTSSGATANRSTYCDIVTHLCCRIQQRRKGKRAKKVFLLHDSARPHSSKQTKAQLDELGYMVLPHPACSPDLVYSDYALFDKMKAPLGGKTFTDADALQGAVHQWCCIMPKDWFQEPIMNLPQWWRRCTELQGNYVDYSWNCHISAMHHCILIRLVSIIFEFPK